MFTKKQIDNFKPTFLYIKKHKSTGKLYFGKTTKKNVEGYLGSGVHWNRHCKKYGKHNVETLWYCLFLDVFNLINFAVNFSINNDIVNSNIWLNHGLENGLNGGIPGHKQTKEQIEKRKETRLKNGNWFKTNQIKANETKIKNGTLGKTNVQKIQETRIKNGNTKTASKGTYITPIGNFISSYDACAAVKLSRPTLIKYCLNNKKGFSFISKNSLKVE